jgi:hypothetical protein
MNDGFVSLQWPLLRGKESLAAPLTCPVVRVAGSGSVMLMTDLLVRAPHTPR